jgi:hypothetical protein
MNTGWAMFVGSYTQQASPLNLQASVAETALVDVNAESAETAYTKVLNTAGSSRPRDAVDTRIASETTNETGTFINSQHDVGGYPALISLPAPIDTDGDGMPDDYEIGRGLNPNDANDASTIASNGYTNLENYLNGILAPTTASVTVGGRVVSAGGRGIPQAFVTLTNSAGASLMTMTNPFGYFRFREVQAGETYVISVRSKRYTFANPSQVHLVNGDITNLIFSATN